MKEPTKLELSLVKTITRHYKSDPKLRVAQVRSALKTIDKMLPELLYKAAPDKWRKVK